MILTTVPDCFIPTDGSRTGAPPSPKLPTLLVIGGPTGLRVDSYRDCFAPPAFSVNTAASGPEGVERVRRHRPDVILLDLDLPDQCGLEVQQQIRRLDPRIPVIVTSMARTADPAIAAMKQGAFDYLSAPIDREQLRGMLEAAFAVAQGHDALTPPADDASDISPRHTLLGGCPAMLDVYKAIGRVAAHNVPVLITGETGTGKELVARALCVHSPRAQRPFLALNCAAIPESLLESELFGHEKGAFSGADRRRIGKFEQCDGGTLLLDEIGDMPPAVQAKILRVLQEQSFQRLGGTETVRTDVRILAATHRDLKAASFGKQFRMDLYYRLSVFTIHLPPLRDRGEDLPLLVRQYLRQFGRELGKDVREISEVAMDCLRRHAWPGNIRELQSVLKQALLQTRRAVLLPAALPEFLQDKGAAESSSPVVDAPDLDTFLRRRLRPGASNLYELTHREVDRCFLGLVLAHTRGNQRQAAKVLGIARQTLRQKLCDLGLQVHHDRTRTMTSLNCTSV